MVRRRSIDEVIEANHKFTIKSKISTLALRIARDAVFGEEVMRQCTVMGNREYPGLPRPELFQIKETLYSLFPELWNAPEEFEAFGQTALTPLDRAANE